ncbi:MAG: gliding motility-associated C-terminal domain-containing protein [Chitinophagales bacterium]|nr:gliding motility-associated C-terminal domain-containing protein [Chitinophagales bacterium]
MKLLYIYITLILFTFNINAAFSCDATDYLLDIANINCNGGNEGSITIRTTHLSGNTPYTYSLDGSTYSNDSVFKNLSAGLYTVSIKDTKGCITTQSGVEVKQPDALSINLKYSPTICGNDAKVFAEISGGTAPYLYEWNGDSKLMADTLRNVNDGFFSLKIKDQNECTSSDTITLPVEEVFNVKILPSALLVNLGDKVELETTITKGSGNYSFQWLPDRDTECPTCETTSYRLYKSTAISVTVHDLTYGCVSTDNVLIETEGDFSLFIPNAFSPNNDGRNDVFKIFGAGVEAATIKIYDKNGFLVYKGDALNEGWDGRVAGKAYPEGLYFYHAEVTYIDKTNDSKKGQLTLIR